MKIKILSFSPNTVLSHLTIENELDRFLKEVNGKLISITPVRYAETLLGNNLYLTDMAVLYEEKKSKKKNKKARKGR